MDEASALCINILKKDKQNKIQCFTNKYNIHSKINKKLLSNTA